MFSTRIYSIYAEHKYIPIRRLVIRLCVEIQIKPLAIGGNCQEYRQDTRKDTKYKERQDTREDTKYKKNQIKSRNNMQGTTRYKLSP